MTVKELLGILVLGIAFGTTLAYGLDRQLQIEQEVQS